MVCVSGEKVRTLARGTGEIIAAAAAGDTYGTLSNTTRSENDNLIL